MWTENIDPEIMNRAFFLLRHPLRREIINVLWEKERSFLELTNTCEMDHGKLGHHLRIMSDLVKHDKIRKTYRLTNEGRLIHEFISQGIFGLQKAIIRSKKNDCAANKVRKKFKTLFNVIPDIIFIVDINGRILDVNDRFQERTGFKKNELLGNSIFKIKLLESKSKAILKNEFKTVFNKIHIGQCIINLITKKFTTVPFEVNSSYIEFEGKPALLLLLRDITEHKRLESELKKANQFLEAVLENIPEAIFIKDNKLRYVYANKTYCDLFNRERSQILGRTIQDLFPEDKAKIVIRQDRETIKKGSVVISQLPSSDSTGLVHLLSSKKVRLKDPEGKVTHVLGIIRDECA